MSTSTLSSGDVGVNSTSKEASKKQLPEKNKKNILITSALPYVNNVPHLGNIIGAVLSADVYARYCRQRGYNTIYVCGTDEYGTATEAKALEEGVTPQEICSKYHTLHKQVYEWFDIKFDIFGRTTTEQQTAIAQDIFLSLHKNNLLTETSQKQLYDPVHKSFLADRFVYGKCPHCGYEDARGDQCDLCGKLLNPMDLINPKSKLSNVTPEEKETEHLYLKLPELQKKLEEWKEKSAQGGNWTAIATTITDTWLKEGLKERCITRDLKWGTPVPLEKYKNKVFYVWFDAPIGYISITANYTDEWEKWWKNPDEVQLVQFMGKDNVPFHSVIFPASLIGTGENWTLVNSLSSTEYLNYEGEKFSKSRGVGVFGDDAKSTGIPPEVWRYYLLTNRPEQSDTDFSWDDFVAKNNNELLANLGNLCNRILKFIANNFEGKVPERSELNEIDNTFVNNVNEELKNYISHLEKVKLKDALHICMKISKLANQYQQEMQPWNLIKSDKSRCATVISLGAQTVYMLTALLEPYIPSFSSKVLSQFNYSPPDGMNRIWDLFDQYKLPEQHQIGVPVPLFKPFDEKQKNEWKRQFAGKGTFKLDLKVGKILTVSGIEGKDKLYKMTIQVGPSQEMQRQIIGGLKPAYSENDLIGREVIVVCNLKHKKLGKEKSQGMLLAAKGADGKPNLLGPEVAGVAPGTQVLPIGVEYEAAKIIGPKEMDLILKDFKTSQDSKVVFGKHTLATVEKVMIKTDKPSSPGTPIS